MFQNILQCTGQPASVENYLVQNANHDEVEKSWVITTELTQVPDRYFLKDERRKDDERTKERQVMLEARVLAPNISSSKGPCARNSCLSLTFLIFEIGIIIVQLSRIIMHVRH